MSNGTQLASDNFTRGSYPVNLGVGGDGWTTVTGSAALQIASAGTVEATTTGNQCAALYTGISAPNDQYSELTLGVIPPSNSDTSLYVRSDANQANCYRFDISGTTGTLYKFISGTPTAIKSLTGLTWHTNDVVRLTVIGTTLMMTVNDGLLAWVSDASISSGKFGILVYQPTNVTLSTVKSWRGGSPSGNTNGIWTKNGVVIPAVLTDFNGTVAIPGTSNSTHLYEGNSQLGLGAGNVFKAWFQGNANGIYYAESLDGQTWTRKAAAVLTGVGIPKIFKNGSTYYLHVTHAPGVWTQIDQYTSTDGIVWSLAHANIISVGGVGTWDHTFCAYFQVVAIIGGIWYGLYDGGSATGAGMGLATSPDGATWTKYASNPVNTAGGPDQVIKVGNLYYSWLTEGVPGQTAGAQGCIARWHTADFITWVREATSLAADSSDEGRNYPSGQMSVASVVEANGSTYMFYSASPNDPLAGSYQIRMASTPRTVAEIVGNQEYFVRYYQTATDNFQRADGSLGANWTTAPSRSALQIASHKAESAVTGAGCNSYYSASQPSNNQWCDNTLATLTNSGVVTGQIVRQSASAQTWYFPNVKGPAGTLNSDLALYKLVAGVQTQIAPLISMTPQLGDVYRFVADGTDISFFQNEHLLLQASDSSIASGFTGMGFFATTAVTDGQVSLFTTGNSDGVIASGNAGVAGATISYTGQASGSVVADASGNYFIGGLANGNYVITPSLAGYTFSPVSASEVVSGSDITGVNFTATTSSGAYSVPDCRVTKPNNATFRTVNGTKIYDVQTSSNPAIPPVDSRVAGAPVDSRIAPNIPENSRTPGLYGPGEN